MPTVETSHRQTIAPQCTGGLRLSGTDSSAQAVESPYFRQSGHSHRKVGPGRDIHIFANMIKATLLGYNSDSPNMDVVVQLIDSNNTYTNAFVIPVTLAYSDDPETMFENIISSVNAWLTNVGYPNPDSYQFLISPYASNLVFATPSLAVNTARQASTTRAANVSVSVDITTTVSLSGGTTGKVSFQYADNNIFTTNLVTIGEFTSSNTGTLVLGLALSQIGTACLSGIVPAGKYYRMLTTNVTGTATYGTPIVQEVLI